MYALLMILLLYMKCRGAIGTGEYCLNVFSVIYDKTIALKNKFIRVFQKLMA